MKEEKKLSREEFQALKTNSPIYKFTVVTGSMAPLIPVGASIVVDTQCPLELNDIVVFLQDGRLICHILWHKNRQLRDQGSEVFATRALDSWRWDLSIRRDDILGKVVNYRVPRWRLWVLRWRDWRRG